MILTVFFSFLSVGMIGGLFGIGLAVASRVLAVEKDPRIESVSNALPGINCGACGFAGCDGYAEAIVAEGAELNLCKPGGPDVIGALGSIMGVEVDLSGEKLVAAVHCRGGNEEATRSFVYEGLADCNAARQLYGGGKTCGFGCLGLGSCVRVCPVDAIHYTRNGLVSVHRDLCISCGKCVEICPTGVMKLIPYGADKIVACNSTDKGGTIRKYCTVGCIGCKKCSKESPEGGFIVEDFLARIDYTQKGERNAAQEACPTKCIVSVLPASVTSGPPEEPNEED